MNIQQTDPSGILSVLNEIGGPFLVILGIIALGIIRYLLKKEEKKDEDHKAEVAALRGQNEALQAQLNESINNQIGDYKALVSTVSKYDATLEKLIEKSARSAQDNIRLEETLIATRHTLNEILQQLSK